MLLKVLPKNIKFNHIYSRKTFFSHFYGEKKQNFPRKKCFQLWQALPIMFVYGCLNLIKYYWADFYKY
jgi:hypothetical protein